MNKIKIIIEKTKDGYSAYAKDLPGIYSQEDTLFAVQDSIAEAIHLFKVNNEPQTWPQVLSEEYSLDFHMGDMKI